MTLGKDITHFNAVRIFENLEDRFREVHKDKYDYSKSIYLGMQQKIEIWCNKHQEYFWQTPDKHLQKRGCPKCGTEERIKKRNTPFSEFVRKANLRHNNKYIYLPDKYINTRSYVDIICPTHGVFNQLATNHLYENGCPHCGNEGRSVSKLKPYGYFLTQAITKHNNKYTYVEDSYTNHQDKMKIICPIHGEFLQSPTVHLKGVGCPHCANIIRQKKYHWKPTTLYYIQIINQGKIYYKIGITVKEKLKDRFSCDDFTQITKIATRLFPTGKEAYTLEQEILLKFKEYLTQDSPLKSGGNSEVFDKDIYPDIQHHFTL